MKTLEGNPESGSHSCSSFLIVFISHRLPLIAVAYLEGTLAIYDLSTQVLRHKCQHEVNKRKDGQRVCVCVF